MVEIIEDKVNISQIEGLKLTKNSRGYSWVISLKEVDPDKIEKINDIMIIKFGGHQSEE